YGTYLHGSLLPKNPRFADHLLRLALRRRHGEVELAPLDDALEDAAHAAAVRVATGR
ncbi:MAG TPA: glutamine amidotransferase, partial [Dehalococcoidia bacterium]|nr:glutamine amidotransferase [Dehalococcoidia bacterium]